MILQCSKHLATWFVFLFCLIFINLFPSSAALSSTISSIESQSDGFIEHFLQTLLCQCRALEVFTILLGENLFGLTINLIYYSSGHDVVAISIIPHVDFVSYKEFRNVLQFVFVKFGVPLISDKPLVPCAENFRRKIFPRLKRQSKKCLPTRSLEF